jgi:NHL repeat
LYIDINNTLYICDYSNDRIQKWIIGAPNGTTIAGNSNGNSGSTATELNRPSGIDFDKNGYMYVADLNNHRIQRFAPGSFTGVTVAGTGVASTSTGALDTPTAVSVDNSFNMYITENGNNRFVLWPANASNSTILINGGAGGVANGQITFPYDFILDSTSSNRVYMSDETLNRVGLWTFGAGVANRTYTTANATALSAPRQILMDPCRNLYVADTNNNRVVVFYSNSTAAVTIVGTGSGSTPALNRASGIAFDSNYNLYVSSTNTHEVLKYARI